MDGEEVEVDGAGVGVGGSVGRVEEATKCSTAPWKILTISSIGSKRKQSISGSVHGWLE